MSLFKIDANNSMGAADIFEKRLLFVFFALSNSGYGAQIEKSGIKDYWSFENSFYGKVNERFVSIVPDPNMLKQLEGQTGNVLAFDFVAEAFQKFQSFFLIPLKMGRLEQSTPLSSPLPTRGFQDNEILYQGYVIDFLDRFNTYLIRTNHCSHIKGPKDYINHFFKFYFSVDPFILKSTFYLSSHVSPGSSGLSLEIASLNAADDKVKVEFIESANFEFYRKAAINSGFLIDKNVPWRLNVDLRSPVIIEKYGNRKILGIDFSSEVLHSHFSKPYRAEMQEIMQALVYGYGDIYDRIKASGDFIETASPPGLEQIQRAFSKNYWTGKHIEMRNKEAGRPFDPIQIESIKVSAFNIKTNTPAEYINEKFTLPWLNEGSLVYEKLKREYRENNNFLLDNFSEHVKIIVQNSINSIY
jgi:hypothetical protein